MAIEAPAAALTTRAEMESIISQTGVDLRIDDDDDGVISSGLGEEESRLTDIINAASDEAYMYLESHYTQVALSESLWVRRRVSYLALHMLSGRRGNPKVYCDEFERYMGQFKEVNGGYLQIPRTKKSHNFEPSLSNQVVDHRYTRLKLRVVRETSTGGTDDRQQLDFQGNYYFY